MSDLAERIVGAIWATTRHNTRTEAEAQVDAILAPLVEARKQDAWVREQQARRLDELGRTNAPLVEAAREYLIRCDHPSHCASHATSPHGVKFPCDCGANHLRAALEKVVKGDDV